jgi:hypothetical protein
MAKESMQQVEKMSFAWIPEEDEYKYYQSSSKKDNIYTRLLRESRQKTLLS